MATSAKKFAASQRMSAAADGSKSDRRANSHGDANLLHDENLVRPETAHVPNKSICNDDDADPELVFFNTFFCPYAQMAWIALNEKGAADKAEFVEGLTIVGGDYHVHPRLRELGHSGVPTIHHPSTGNVVSGSTECILFIY